MSAMPNASASLGRILRLLGMALVLAVIVGLGVAAAITLFSPLPDSAAGRFWAVGAPAGVCVIATFAIIVWRYRSESSFAELKQVIKDMWDAFGRAAF